MKRWNQKHFLNSTETIKLHHYNSVNKTKTPAVILRMLLTMEKKLVKIYLAPDLTNFLMASMV